MHKRVTRTAAVIGLGLLALAVGVVVIEDRNQARAAAQMKVTTNDKILKLVAAIRTNDKVETKKLMDELVKGDLDEVMEAFKPKSKGGIDGIQKRLEELAKAVPKPADLVKNAAALQQAAFVVGAVADVCLAKGPPGVKGVGKWVDFVQEMKGESAKLLKAIKEKDGPNANKAARKILNTCVACHSEFK